MALVRSLTAPGAVARGTPPLPGGSDGVKGLADAALQSLQTGRAVVL